MIFLTVNKFAQPLNLCVPFLLLANRTMLSVSHTLRLIRVEGMVALQCLNILDSTEPCKTTVKTDMMTFLVSIHFN